MSPEPTAPDSATPPPRIDTSKLTRGVAAFAALSVGGLGVLFVFTLRGDFAQVVSGLSGRFFTLAVLAMLADLLIGAIRYQIFLVRIKPGVSLWLPLKADLATRFTGAVTPSQTGGGPAQIFVLWKGGIPVSAALSFLMINLMSTLTFFLLAGGITAWWLQDYFPAGAVQYLIQWGFVSFALAFALILTGLIRPDLLVKVMTPAVRRLEASPRGWAHFVAKGGRVLIGSVDHYQQTCVEFIREAPWLPVASFLITAVLYTNKFVLAYFVMRGLGVDGDFLTMIAAQALLHFVLFIIPTPGGSGFAELGTGAIMAILIPTSLLGPFTLAYRFFLIYLPSVVGAVVLAQEIRPRSDPRDPVQEQAALSPV